MDWGSGLGLFVGGRGCGVGFWDWLNVEATVPRDMNVAVRHGHPLVAYTTDLRKGQKKAAAGIRQRLSQLHSDGKIRTV